MWGHFTPTLEDVRNPADDSTCFTAPPAPPRRPRGRHRVIVVPSPGGHTSQQANSHTLGNMKLFKISTGLVIEADSGVLHLATASTVPPPPACPPVDFDLWCVHLESSLLPHPISSALMLPGPGRLQDQPG